MQILSELRKIPPAEALLGFSVDAPSLFAFIQDVRGGNHITSFMVGALGGLMLTLQALRKLNFCISPL